MVNRAASGVAVGAAASAQARLASIPVAIQQCVDTRIIFVRFLPDLVPSPEV
jgi:hypothetical protein